MLPTGRGRPSSRADAWARGRRFLVTLLTLALASAIAAEATPLHAMAPTPEFEQRIVEADDHASHGRHAQALRAYSEALAAMPRELAADSVGEFVAVAAGKAALDEFEASGDQVALAMGRMVLLMFVGMTTSADGTSDEARLVEVRELLVRIDAAMSSVPTQAPPVAPSDPFEPSEPAHDQDAVDADEPEPLRKPLVIGLAVPGSMAMLAGVVLVVAGASQVRYAKRNLEELGYVPDDVQYGTTIGDAERARNIDIGLAVGLLGVGGGLIAAAALVASKNRRGTGRVSWMPVLGRERAMLGAELRF